MTNVRKGYNDYDLKKVLVSVLNVQDLCKDERLLLISSAVEEYVKKSEFRAGDDIYLCKDIQGVCKLEILCYEKLNQIKYLVEKQWEDVEEIDILFMKDKEDGEGIIRLKEELISSGVDEQLVLGMIDGSRLEALGNSRVELREDGKVIKFTGDNGIGYIDLEEYVVRCCLGDVNVGPVRVTEEMFLDLCAILEGRGKWQDSRELKAIDFNAVFDEDRPSAIDNKYLVTGIGMKFEGPSVFLRFNFFDSKVRYLVDVVSLNNLGFEKLPVQKSEATVGMLKAVVQANEEYLSSTVRKELETFINRIE